jgi:hypothetical protein
LSDREAFITGTDFLIDGGAAASYFYGLFQPGTGEKSLVNLTKK